MSPSPAAPAVALFTGRRSGDFLLQNSFLRQNNGNGSQINVVNTQPESLEDELGNWMHRQLSIGISGIKMVSA